MRRVAYLAFCMLADCAAPQRPAAELDAQLRAMHQEQERQARTIELLESRVVLAEDSARLARQALAGATVAHQTVRIADDAPAPALDAIPSALNPTADGNEIPDEDPRDTGTSDANRPLLRLTGREANAPAGPPIVLRDDDRLPVAPVPSPSVPRGRTLTPAPMLPMAEPMPLPAASVHPGVSSVRDTRAAPAYEQALALARSGQCPGAVEAFTQFLVRWPDHPFADNAMYWRGECMLSAGDTRRAAGEFEGLLARFPVGNKAPDALYKLMICYQRLGDPSRAHTYAARLLREFPHSEVAARVRAERTP